MAIAESQMVMKINSEDKARLKEIAQSMSLPLSSFVRMTALEKVKQLERNNQVVEAGLIQDKRERERFLQDGGMN